MNENQKKVTDQYRSNWDDIFKKKEPIPFVGWVDNEDSTDKPKENPDA